MPSRSVSPVTQRARTPVYVTLTVTIMTRTGTAGLVPCGEPGLNYTSQESSDCRTALFVSKWRHFDNKVPSTLHELVCFRAQAQCPRTGVAGTQGSVQHLDDSFVLCRVSSRIGWCACSIMHHRLMDSDTPGMVAGTGAVHYFSNHDIDVDTPINQARNHLVYPPIGESPPLTPPVNKINATNLSTSLNIKIQIDNEHLAIQLHPSWPWGAAACYTGKRDARWENAAATVSSSALYKSTLAGFGRMTRACSEGTWWSNCYGRPYWMLEVRCHDLQH